MAILEHKIEKVERGALNNWEIWEEAGRVHRWVLTIWAAPSVSDGYIFLRSPTMPELKCIKIHQTFATKEWKQIVYMK